MEGAERSARKNPHAYDPVIFNKVPNHSVGNKTLFTAYGVGQTGFPHAEKKMKLDLYFTSYTKINS